MKRLCNLIVFIKLFLIGSVVGQTNLPTLATGPNAATAKKLPPIYASTAQNFVRTYSPIKPITDTTQINISAAPEDITTGTTYMDSYGRPLQKVAHKATAAKIDLVSPKLYDEFGNSSTQYLNFPAQSGNTNDGGFKLNAFSQDSTFYRNNFPGEQVYYDLTYYDASPFNIELKRAAPGNSWAGSGVARSFTHRTNTNSDSVKLWIIGINNENDVPTTSSNYLANSLNVIQVTDEQGNISIKYLDALGRIVLTKRKNSSTPSSGHYGWLCTYYVYDELNHLRYVITPKAVELLTNLAVNWNLTSNPTIGTGLCYAYFFDNRGRQIVKKIPGKGKTYFAFDSYDRVVMIQDSNLRITSQWAFVLYDSQLRPQKNGLITIALSKDSVFAQAARSTNYPTLSGTYTVTKEVFYDDYSWISGSGTSLSSSLITTNINSSNFISTFNSSPEYAQQITQSSRIRGILTGTKELIINTSTYLYSVNIYDDHGRGIQKSLTNYSGGIDVATFQYGFSGSILRNHLAHQKLGSNSQVHTLLTKYSYDHVGRIKSVTKNLDNSSDKTLTQNTYNELGQLTTKNIGSTTSETQNYSYNIRGWLLGINSSYINTAGSTSNYFGESLFYDYGFTNNRLNGNIAGVKWKAFGDGIARAYGFSYDMSNQLTSSDFSQQNSGSTSWTQDKVDYSVSGLTYDANSNILSLKQKGLRIGSSVTIDSLNYQYFSNSNQLQKVSDGISDNSALGDFKDSSYSGDDYAYDANGNTVKDYNKHMVLSSNGPGAVYNYLDKPDSLVVNGKAGIHYYYTADGFQIRKQVNNYVLGVIPSIQNYVYLNGFVYLNDTLSYILQDEGRIRYAKKVNNSNGATYYAFEYEYFIKDHLGNVRTVITEGRDTATYSATMETKDSVVVQALFKNVYDPTRTVNPKPASFDTDTSNHFVSRLNATPGTNIKMGPSITLKVMAGDKIQASVYSFYNTPVQPPPGGVNMLTDILTVLGQEVVNNSAGKFGQTDVSGVNNALNPNVTSFLNTGRSYDSTKPKAYLNWILFDDQFNYVASNSGVAQVQPGASSQVLAAPLQTISKNGYLYVYVSNESQEDVFFDKLTIKHYTGPLSQEMTYYPFGLVMAGISDKALLKPNSPYKFDGGMELEEDAGINYYNTFYRKYDPQTGRFAGIDGLAETNSEISPYQFGGNNPAIFNDPSGALFGKSEREHAGGIQLGDGSWMGSMFGSTEGEAGPQELGPTIAWGGGNGGLLSEIGSGPFLEAWKNILGEFLSSGQTETSFNIQTSYTYINWSSDTRRSGMLLTIHDYGEEYIENGNDWLKYQSETNILGNVLGIAEEIAKELYDSRLGRLLIPDMIGFNLNINLTPGVGLNYAYQFSLITRGKNLGWHTSQSTYVSAGQSMGISVNVVAGTYIGPVQDVNFNSYLGEGWSGDMSFDNFNAGAWGSNGPNGPSWIGGSIGIGPGFGASISTGDTHGK